mgnify:CR=1 FL=1
MYSVCYRSYDVAFRNEVICVCRRSTDNTEIVYDQEENEALDDNHTMNSEKGINDKDSIEEENNLNEENVRESVEEII